MKRMFFLIVAVFIVSGCGSFKVSMDHADYRELISKEFDDELWVFLKRGSSIMRSSADEANAPRDSLSVYCQRDGGGFVRVSRDKDVLFAHRDVAELSGIFACVTPTDQKLWMVEIDAEPMSLNSRGYLMGYEFKVREYSIDKYESMVAQKKYNAELAKRKKEKHINYYKSMLDIAKGKGDKVCSWSNKYGFVEELSGNKIKILVKGVASGVDSGFFFLEGEKRFRSSPMDKYIWDEPSNWGACEFTL